MNTRIKKEFEEYTGRQLDKEVYNYEHQKCIFIIRKWK